MIPESLVQAVREYKALLQAQNKKMKNPDSDLLYNYSEDRGFVVVLKRFLNANGYTKVKSHDFRVSKACEMYVEHGDIERIRLFFQHSDHKTTRCYIKPEAEQIR